MAHYAQACTDIEYAFPWGKGEVEGVAHRGSYDLDVCGFENVMMTLCGFDDVIMTYVENGNGGAGRG